ncbi:MAG: (d)CMP kinase [Phycisphaerae bacterium]|nr:(d)CMP kinase [Phycisphaerae bacterium]
MIVTIDGPAGAGKSTVARRLAGKLGIAYLDTGAMYRAIALRALRRGVDPEDQERLARMAGEAELSLDCRGDGVRVLLDGEDVTEAIRGMEVNQVTSLVAKVQGVRDVLVRQQQEIGRRLGSLVTEGRDQGSVVFPKADVKFVLDASVETRARRRCEELGDSGQDVSFDEVRTNLTERDDRDSPRWAPLLEPGRAIRIDTSDMTIDQVVDRLAGEVRDRSGTTP